MGESHPVTQRPPRHPLRGWLIAILVCLVLSLITQAVTLALLVPRLVTASGPTKVVTLVAVSTGVEATATVTLARSPITQSVSDGLTLTLPTPVAFGDSVLLTLAANDPNQSAARITCIVRDETGADLVNISSLVRDRSSVSCLWTNDRS